MYFLKQCVYTLDIPIHIIFNLSLNSLIFPEYWKHSFLKPIYKSGPKHNVENYRAVCIQSELPKLLDCLVTRLLTWECKNLLIDEQHGFIQGRSINTNLLIYENFIINTFESRLQVDSVYTDFSNFSKAFDRVNHSLLLPKLKALGIDGKVLMWIQSSLSSRTQSVKYGGSV